MTETATIRFDRYVLDPADARLTGPSGPLPVGDKALRVLRVLLNAGGRLVTKDELFDIAWDGVIVTESTLTTVIKELRRALDDPARNPRFIESVYGKGYRFLMPAEAGSAPAPRGDAPVIGNLPNAASDLIGREDELALLAERLADGGLVSVVGPAGAGKTSLALEVARRDAGRHVDGAWLVELAPIRNAVEIAYAIAAAMRLELAATREPREALIDVMRRREALLVLDNAEHLIEGAAELVRALRAAAPGVTVLVTSREALALAGENVVRLGALAPSAAQALFVTRAVSADPRFDAGGANAEAIAAICARLDHLALAIEMAAARAPLLGCGAVVERLDDRFALLKSGHRGGEARQRTLRAALEWSHDLLDPDEAIAFRRLGVFSSSFALAAAATVVDLDKPGRVDVFDAIASLVGKSLLVALPGEAGMRYRMLETMRAFALEKLAEAGETAAAWRAKAHWLMTHTAPFWDEYFGTLSEAALTARYQVERDNLTAAIDWTQANDEPDAAIRLFCNCWALWPEYRVHRLMPQMIALTNQGTSPDLRARLLGAEAHSLMRFQPIDAVAKADEAIAAIAAVGGETWPLVDVLCSKGNALWLLGRIAEAEAVSAEIASRVPEFATTRLAAHAKGLRACLALARGGLSAARPIFAELDEELRRIGADGLANFWVIRLLQFDAEAPLDDQISSWRSVLAAVEASQARYAEALSSTASLELVMRLGERGREADLAEARVLLGRCFRLGGLVLEYRLYLAMALVVLRSGNTNEGTRLFGLAEGLRLQGGETALTRASFARVRAWVERALPDEQRERLIREGTTLAASAGSASLAERFRPLIAN